MPLKMRRILCAIDFSRFTRPLLEQAAHLVRPLGGELIIFHTVSFPRSPFHGAPRPRLEGGGERRRFDEAHAKITALMADTDISWQALIVSGDPTEQLCAAVSNLNVDLVMAASHGLRGVARMLVGTVVEQASRVLTCPLWVLRPGPKNHRHRGAGALNVKTIMAGCDFSTAGHQVCRYAGFLSDVFHARLYLLHAIESPLDETVIDPRDAPYGNVQQQLVGRLQQRLSALAASVAPNIDVHPVVVPGIPAEKLLIHARRTQADLIVVGVRPRGRFQKLWIGSTTESMLRQASCPVVTIGPAVDTGGG